MFAIAAVAELRNGRAMQAEGKRCRRHAIVAVFLISSSVCFQSLSNVEHEHETSRDLRVAEVVRYECNPSPDTDSRTGGIAALTTTFYALEKTIHVSCCLDVHNGENIGYCRFGLVVHARHDALIILNFKKHRLPLSAFLREGSADNDFLLH